MSFIKAGSHYRPGVTLKSADPLGSETGSPVVVRRGTRDAR
jgi:hypothetical protein